MTLEDRLFDDDSRYLDKFGWLLVLAAASVGINSIIDLDEPLLDLASEIMWVVASLIVGGTVQLALRASGAARRPRIIASVIVWVFVLSAIVMAFVGTIDPDTNRYTTGARPTIAWVILAFVAPVFVIRRLFRQQEVGRETLMGAFAAFLLIALAFHYAFLSTVSWNGQFFTTVESTSSFMYFSLVTITTLGYGDLQPMSNVARLLSTSEAVVGQVFLLTIVARLVSMYGTTTPKARAHSEDQQADPSA